VTTWDVDALQEMQWLGFNRLGQSADGITVSFLTLQDIHNRIFMDFITIPRNKGAEEAILLVRLPPKLSNETSKRSSSNPMQCHFF
jgi:hypothetical protein